MNKILFIGDVHGTSSWQIIKHKLDQYSQIVFLGDYADSFDKTDSDIMYNLKEIINLKKDNQDKITLLLGNHDIHYMYPEARECSGKRFTIQPDLQKMYRENVLLFQVAWQYKKILATHAGLTNASYTYLYKHQVTPIKFRLADRLNYLFRSRDISIFLCGPDRRGTDEFSGILWLDLKTLIKNPLKDYIQIVGHSHVDKLTEIKVNETTKVICVDYTEYHPLEPFFELDLG